jgi:putative flippase GtrA
MKGMSDEFARLLRFGIVGLAAFLVYSGAMLAVTETNIGDQVVGAFVGFIFGTTISFIGNSLYVFRAGVNAGGAVRFWIVTLVGLGLNLIIAYWLEKFGLRPLGTAVIIFATVPMLNYAGHRIWTFRDSTLDSQRSL